MSTNYANMNQKLIHPELSYTITGICFAAHNELGRFGREKQYCDFLEAKFKEIGLPYKREYSIGETGNIVDFLIDDKIVLEAKSKRLLNKEDFYQTQRYLQNLNKKLGLLVNFRNRYLKPVRIVKIESDTRKNLI
ncbi:MAG: GxxExxY protein [Candidatus Liptonbacteria bacterium]|nr:GxxExxY protein [Candidatus Liptonbacteria bacterium]